MNIEKINKLFKFSWGQAFSSANGKTSIIAISGFYLVSMGGIVLLLGAIHKQSDVMMYGLAECTLGAGLLGYRKGVNGKSEGTSPKVTEEDVKTDVAETINESKQQT